MIHPDAIIVLSAGTVFYTDSEGRECYRLTTYEDRDAFGTMGGSERAEATAILAQRHPQARVVTTARRMDGEKPTLAETMEEELVRLGVPSVRIIREENSTTTGSQISEALLLSKQHGWQSIIFVTSEYHIPRTKAMYEALKSDLHADFISAESILIEHDPDFQKTFDTVKETQAYKDRLTAEARGIEALRSGEYKEASKEDKMER
jgi:uncharacterized SAM-binding protein YcdF (DUF218 family)